MINGYEDVLNLVTVNTKTAQKLLSIKNKNDSNGQALGEIIYHKGSLIHM